MVPFEGDYSWAVGLIVATYIKNGKKETAKTTGTLINFYKKFVIFTCAHAVWIQSTSPKPIEIEQATFYPRMTNDYSPIGYPIKRWLVHPEYVNTGYNYKQGTDFAILFLEKNIDIKLVVDNAELGIYNHEIDSKFEVKVYGYPNEKGIDPYEMNGTISDYTPTQDRATICYSDIFTTPGQSGGPVFVRRNPKSWSIIGIHVARDTTTNLNYATAITKDIYSWLLKVIK